MGASFSFELLKLRKRPATLILTAVLLLIVALLGYLLGYAAIAGIDGDPPPETEAFLTQLYPENMVANVLAVLSGIGGAVALILGALAVGSEYGWDTIKAILTQRPNRVKIFSGKLLAVGVVLAELALMSLMMGALGSYVVAALQDAPVEWPSFGELARGMGAGWLMMAAWAAMGAFLAVLFRGTALAIGLGLAYALILENLVFGLSFENESVEKVGQGFLGRNSADLASSFGGAPKGVPAQPFEAVEPAQATLILGAYVVVFVALSLLVFWRRDVA